MRTLLQTGLIIMITVIGFIAIMLVHFFGSILEEKSREREVCYVKQEKN
jgi:hypothetical protein